MDRRPRRKRSGRYHHGDLRRALIDAALEVIDEEGPAAVTIRALARRLGVSHAAPHHHFADREALVAEVATEGFRLFADALEAAACAEQDPKERLIALGRAYVRFATQHPSYLRVMFGRGFPDGFVPPQPLQEEGARAYRVLTDAVAALAETASGPPVPLDEMAFAMWSLVHGMATLWCDGPTPTVHASEGTLEAVAERIVRRALPGLVPGPARP